MAKKPLAQNDWDESSGDESVATPAPSRQTTPLQPDLKFPPNASRNDLLQIKARAEEVLKQNPNYEAAKVVLTEANERLRWFTTSGLTVPKTAERLAQEVISIREEAESVTLPADYETATKLYREVLRMPERNRRERAVKKLRKKFVGGHLFRMQQLPPAPDTRPAERFAAENAALASASRLRKERLEKLKARITARGQK